MAKIPTIWVQTSTRKTCENCKSKVPTFIAGYYYAAKWGRLFGFCEYCSQNGGFRSLLATYSNLGSRSFSISARSGYQLPKWVFMLAEEKDNA